eukprot:362866-Chlamydomonas_euryale.AAC.31
MPLIYRIKYPGFGSLNEWGAMGAPSRSENWSPKLPKTVNPAAWRTARCLRFGNGRKYYIRGTVSDARKQQMASVNISSPRVIHGPQKQLDIAGSRCARATLKLLVTITLLAIPSCLQISLRAGAAGVIASRHKSNTGRTKQRRIRPKRRVGALSVGRERVSDSMGGQQSEREREREREQQQGVRLSHMHP